jgi:hypothetical protein
LWELVTVTQLVGPGLVPAPLDVLTVFWERLTGNQIWLDIDMSCQRVLLGLACGIAAAIPVAFLRLLPRRQRREMTQPGDQLQRRGRRDPESDHGRQVFRSESLSRDDRLRRAWI